MPAAGDLAVAQMRVAGRPLVFRVIVAAVRAGATRVYVPTVLRDVLVAPLEGSPAARGAVRWLAPDAPAPPGPVLLAPVVTLVSPATLAVATVATPPAVVAESLGDGAPVAAATAPVLGRLWPALSRGAPVGDSLEREVAAAAPIRVGGDAGVRVRGEADARRAEERLYAGLGSVIDTALDTHLHRRLSRYVSRLAVVTGITPNQLTIASLIVGAVAAGCFALATPGSAVAGLLVYLAAVVLDHADGEVARLTLTESPLGARLDVIADTVVHGCVVVALGVAVEALTGRGALLGAVGALGIVGSAVAAFRWPPRGQTEDRLGAFLEDLGSRDGFYAMLIGFVVAIAWAPSALPALMMLVAAGSHAYWIGRVGYRLVRR